MRQTVIRAGATRTDLSWRLRRIGVHITVKEVHRRLDQGAFRATFMLQMLVALGAQSIELPGHLCGQQQT